MSELYHKKKQPEQVRARLLEVAARRIGKDGVATLRLEAVAQEAGVSKGGLFHHFPNKTALLEGLYEDGSRRFDEQLAELMEADPEPHGRFTRAYLRSACLEEDSEEMASFFNLILGSSDFKARMVQWMRGRLEQHKDTDSFTEAKVVLHAADGLWMSLLIDERKQLSDFRETTRAALLAMTYPKA